MKIGIVGAGSIGLLFAAYLSGKFDVTIYTRSSEQAERINENGVWLKSDHQQVRKKVAAQPFREWKGQQELLIITVKQYHLFELIEPLNQHPNSASLLFLQNGMGHLKQLEQLAYKDIIVGTVEHGALKENDFTVLHNGQGVTRIAVFQGGNVHLEKLISHGETSFPFVEERNYLTMLQNKLIVNAVINPLTAILRIRNGLLIENPFYFTLLKGLFEEIAEILNIEKKEEHLQRVIAICRNTASNRSSMLKDLDHSRLTEVDSILGYVMEEAEHRQVAMPIGRAFFEAVKGKEYEGGK